MGRVREKRGYDGHVRTLSRRTLLGCAAGALVAGLARAGGAWAQAPGPLVTVHKDPT